MNDNPKSLSLSQNAIYEIKVQGRISQSLLDWADCLSMTTETPEGYPSITTFTGPVVDQSALHGLLKRIRDLGLPILVVRRIEQDEPENKNNEIDSQ
jgi:hypothetical protein